MSNEKQPSPDQTFNPTRGGRSRRKFMIGGVGVAAAAAGVYVVNRPRWVVVGPPSIVPEQGVHEFVDRKRGVFLMRDESGTVYALSQRCAHQGCDVEWKAQPRRFECPCHDGVYSAGGERISGLPFRGLDRLDTRINEDGDLEVLV